MMATEFRIVSQDSYMDSDLVICKTTIPKRDQVRGELRDPRAGRIALE